MATITLPTGSTSTDLQAAINGAASGDTIQLSSDMDFLDTVVVPAELAVTIASTAGNAWVMAQTVAGRHFVVAGDLTLTNIVADGNYPPNLFGAQGGFDVTGSLTLQDGAVIEACYADDGGAVLLSGGSMAMEDGSAVSGNTAQSQGGGISVGAGAGFSLTGGTISGNRVLFDSGAGGGVHVGAGGYFAMTGGLIRENTLNLTANQGGTGGGVAVRGGVFVLSAGTVSSNRCILYGAGIGIAAGGTVTITGGNVVYNGGKPRAAAAN